MIVYGRKIKVEPIFKKPSKKKEIEMNQWFEFKLQRLPLDGTDC